MNTFRSRVVVLLTCIGYTATEGVLNKRNAGETKYPICTKDDNAPKQILDIHDEIKPYLHHFKEDCHNGNKKRKCCGTYGCYSLIPKVVGTDCSGHTCLPKCQDELGVTFLLWTSRNIEDYDIIYYDKDASWSHSNMAKNSNVIIYIDGYLGSGDMAYIKDIKNAILNKEPKVMFISVDWTKGARSAHNQSIANGQTVAAVTARMIQKLNKKYYIQPEKIHIIGVNIGAHIAGAIGKMIPGIGRITGLDPLGWKGVCPAILKMSMTDAKFVDVIHTNGRTYGTFQPLGHLDIYINGALDQPACAGCLGCNHTIVILYYLETILKDQPYLAYQCDSYNNFLRGKCSKGCGKSSTSCAPMGYRAHEWSRHKRSSPTLMFMSMGTNHDNFHLYHYFVKITFQASETMLWKYGRSLDKMTINLIGDNNRQTGDMMVHPESLTYDAEPTVTAIVTSEHQVGKIAGATVTWLPNAKSVADDDDCLDRYTRQSDSCMVKSEFDCNCVKSRYKLKNIIAKNLETGVSSSFNKGVGEYPELAPNRELKITCRQ